MARPSDEVVERIASLEIGYRLIEDETRQMLEKAGVGHEHFKALSPRRLRPLPEQLPRHERLSLPFKSIVRKRMKASFPEFKATKIGDDLAYVRPVSRHVEVLFGFDHPAPESTIFSIYLGVRAGDDVLDCSICRTSMARLLRDQLVNEDWPCSTEDQLEAALDDVAHFLDGVLLFWERRVRHHLVPLPQTIAERFTPRQLTARQAYEEAAQMLPEEYRHARHVVVESIACLDDALSLNVESVAADGRLLPWAGWRFQFQADEDERELLVQVYACGESEVVDLPVIERQSTIDETWIDSDAAVRAALKKFDLDPATAVERQLQFRCAFERSDRDVRRRTGLSEAWKIMAVGPDEAEFFKEAWVPVDAKERRAH